MNVLSLFDGMSCGQIALNRLGIKYDNYFASEIEDKPIKVTMANFPKTIQIGDVLKVKGADYPKIDLMMGGSPCQGFSTAGKGLNFNDPRSKLFFEFTRLKEEVKPTWWLLENVKMKAEYRDLISEHIGCQPIFINSASFSAQNRQRLYWTNIPHEPIPERSDIKLQDILEYGFVDREKSYCIDANYAKGGNAEQYFKKKRRQLAFESQPIHYDTPNRKLTPTECERLQTVPEGYTDHVAAGHRYKMLGNGWTVDVISHLLSHLAK